MKDDYEGFIMNEERVWLDQNWGLGEIEQDWGLGD